MLLMSGLDQIMCVRAIKRMGPCHSVPREEAESARLAEGCLNGWEAAKPCKKAGCDSSLDCAAAAQPQPALRPSVGGAALLSPMQRLAAQMGVGHVAVREALRPKLREAGVFRKVIDSLVLDFLHFTRPGHELVAELLEHRILSAVPTARVGSGHCHAPSVDGTLAVRHDGTRDGIPANTGGGAVCAFGQLMQPLVRKAVGWNWKMSASPPSIQHPPSPLSSCARRARRDYAKGGQAKPGYAARAPGAQLEVCVPLPADMAVGEQRRWAFAYLASHWKMGIVTSECYGTCTCPPGQLDAHVPGGHTSVTQVSPQVQVRKVQDADAAAVAAAGCGCVVRLTVSNHSRSGGYDFKVIALFAGLGKINYFDKVMIKSGLARVTN